MVRSVLLLLGVGVATHVLLPQIDSFQNSLSVLGGMQLWALGAAVIAQGLSYFGSGILLRGIALLGGRPIRISRGMMVTSAAYSVGLVAGGIVGSSTASYRWMRKGGASAESAVLAGWLPGLLDDLLLIGLALAGVIFLLIEHSLTRAEAIGFVLVASILLVLVAGLYWIARHPGSFTALARRMVGQWASLRRRRVRADAVDAQVKRFLQTLDLLFGRGWKLPVFGAVLSILFDMATLLFIFVAAGNPVPAGVLLVGYGLPLLFGKAPLLPGGIGLVEGTMAAIYGGLGVPHPVIIVVVLVYRLQSFWLPLLIGLPLIPYLERQSESGRVGAA